MSLSKAQILEAQDMPVEKTAAPEWGGDVFLRTMSGTERDAWEASCDRGKNLENIRARLLVRCLCDEKGERLFADTDAASLGRRSALVLDRLWNKACAMNGLGGEAVEEAAKNSGGSPAGDSGSG